jgi:hypothetical protein
MTNLYPNGGEFYAVWEGPLNLVLAYPFHRVTSNLENLILITIYMGVLHVLFGLVLGFLDIYKAHGFVDALFEKGSWMTVVIGGFIFAYGLLVESASDILLPGAAITGVGVVMVMVLLAHFEKMGVIGGSYGGYMVLAALAFQPEAFEVGVDIFGVANWLRTLESIPPWWEAFRKALYEEIGDPGKDRDYLIRISPLFHTDKIRKPLIVLQGANDPRVLKVESDEIVAAVRKNNVPVEYVVFPDEGHGFIKKEGFVWVDGKYFSPIS